MLKKYDFLVKSSAAARFDFFKFYFIENCPQYLQVKRVLFYGITFLLYTFLSKHIKKSPHISYNFADISKKCMNKFQF